MQTVKLFSFCKPDSKSSLLAILSLILLMISCEEKAAKRPGDAGLDVQLYADEVAQAAQALIKLTPAQQRDSLVYPFDSDERVEGKETDRTPSFCAVLAWCLPGWGLQVGDLNQEQLVAMHKMLNLALSPGGYQTLLAVINRQRIIGEMEDVSESQTIRDAMHNHPHDHASSIFDLVEDEPDSLFYPSLAGGKKTDTSAFVKWIWDPIPGLKGRWKQFNQYTLAIFGEPDSGGEWGFRFEGHHITVNMTFVPDPTTGAIKVHATPLFFGAFPLVIPAPPYAKTDPAPQWNWEKGQLMMFSVAHHLRQFWLAVPETLRDQAFISSESFPQTPPLEVDTPLPFMISSLDPSVDTSRIKSYPHIEIRTDELTAEARWHLKQAYLFYLGAMNPNIGTGYVARLDQALAPGQPLTLSWAGKSLEVVGSHHYSYVVVGSLLLEFLQSNQFVVQHNPEVTGNHLHSMLRDLSFDWMDPMQKHHVEDHLQTVQ